MSTLSWMIIWPLAAAVVLLGVPRTFRVVMRGVAIAATLIAALLAIKMFAQFSPGQGFQFEEQRIWVSSLGISYHVGVDGLNAGLVLMAALVGFAAACAAWQVKEREKEFYVLLLVMVGGVIGAFASLDLFFFYFFHELALVPTFIMIGVWGRGVSRNYAAFQITLYLSVGALLALIGLIGIYVQAGSTTFDIPALVSQVSKSPFSTGAQRFLFPLLLFGFGILVSLWPFHTWAPLGYGSAPAPTAMLHAGVLKKFGLYGLLRIALPLMPDAARAWMPVLAWLCLGNLVYCGWVAMRQKDLNWLVGYSSVAHMGFVFLGIASFNAIGITGAVIVMVAHGFLAALLFAITGYLHEQTGTLEMAELGGLLRRLPFIGTLLVAAAFAACGLPGFANFAGEITVLFGAWKTFPVPVILACWGALVVGAVYMLRTVRRVLHGPLSEKWAGVVEPGNAWRKVPYVLLAVVLVLFGCWPRLLSDKIRPAAEATILQAQAASAARVLVARNLPDDRLTIPKQ